MNYGQRMKEARKAAGLTQEQLAKECDVATITIRQYEACKREPRISQFERIAEALDIDVNWLMHGKTLEQRDQENKDRVAEKFALMDQLKKISQLYNDLNLDGKLEAGAFLTKCIDPKHTNYVIKHLSEMAGIPQYQSAKLDK